MRKIFSSLPSCDSAVAVESEFHDPRNLDAVLVHTAATIVGMNVHDAEVAQDLIKTCPIQGVHEGIKNLLEVMKFNDHDSE
jgi:hypothetical protein